MTDHPSCRGHGARVAFAAALTVLLALGAARGADLRTRNGTVYTNATIVRVDADGVDIRHAGGICKIPVRLLDPLPPEIEVMHRAAVQEEDRRRQADQEARARLADLERQVQDLRRELGEYRDFTVRRKLDPAAVPGIAFATNSRVYEIVFDDRKPAVVECMATRFVDTGRAALWMQPRGSALVDLATGFDATVPVFVESPPERVVELDRLLAQLPCRACAASGKCAGCAGTGVVACPACRGTGRGVQVTTETPCPRCRGKGHYASALGVYIPCTQCGKTGVLKQTKIPPCPDCGGRGRIVCPRCQGARACPACQGRGRGSETH